MQRIISSVDEFHLKKYIFATGYNSSMKNFLTVLLIFGIVSAVFGQVKEDKSSEEVVDENTGPERKFAPKKDKRERPPATDYKIISFQRDTTYVDTTLSMQKEYRFNYLRTDDFELLPFPNVGPTYTSLAKVNEPFRLLPRIGARAKHFNFLEVEDINYYNVPTPLTEAYFKTTFEQGQQLDIFFTVNLSPQFNISFAYKGMRSLGKYKNVLTSTGNFRTSVSYHTSNNRYQNRMHFTSQDLLSQENGGLTEEALELYLLGLNEGDRESDQREQLDVNFEDADNFLKGKRFYLDHQYAITQTKDSIPEGSIYIRHQLDITDKSYRFTQTTAAPLLFGQSLVNANLRDKVSLEDFYNNLSVNLNAKNFGIFSVGGSTNNYNYGYNSIYIFDDGNRITNRLKSDMYACQRRIPESNKKILRKGQSSTIHFRRV